MRGSSRSAMLAAALVAVCVPVAALTPRAPAASATVNPHAPFLGVIPSQPVAPAGAQPQSGSPVTYHGGPVQHASVAYPIFWVPSGYALPFPANYQAVVNRFFTDVAAYSYKPSNVFSVATQYYDVVNNVKQPVFYAATAKPVIVDTRPYPANGCANYPLKGGGNTLRCLTNAQLVNELKVVINTLALPAGMSTNFFIFTPSRVGSCNTAGSLSSGGCYDPAGAPGFCAYHSFTTVSGKNVLFAYVPYAAIVGCASGQSPQNSAADSALNTASHEYLETMTDPLGTAWFDTSGNEIADECVSAFGSPLGTNAFGKYNEVINGRGYWLQEMWSNRAGACVQRNTFVQPVASFTNTTPVHGQPTAFQSTSHNPDTANPPLKVRWVFPGGTTSAVVNPQFTFPTAGTFTVSLVVWDVQGDQARVQKSIVAG